MRILLIALIPTLFSFSAFAQEDSCVDGSFCDASGDAHNCDGVDTVTTCVDGCRVVDSFARCTLNEGDLCIEVAEVCSAGLACVAGEGGDYRCAPELLFCDPNNVGVCQGNFMVWSCLASDDLPVAFADDCGALGGSCDESIFGCSSVQNGGTCDETPGCSPGNDCFWLCEEECSNGTCVAGGGPPPGEGEGEGEGPPPPAEGEGEGEDFEEREREEGEAPSDCQSTGSASLIPVIALVALFIRRLRA